MTRLLVLGHLGGRNFGDEAMLDALIGCCSGADPDVEWSIVAPGGPTAPTAVQDDRTAYIDQTLKSVARGVLGADALVIAGGTTFHDQYRGSAHRKHLITLARFVGISAFARLLGRRVFLAGVGLGPVTRRATRWLTAAWLHLATHVSVRDPASMEIAKGMGLKPDRLAEGFDLAVLGRYPQWSPASGEKQILVNLVGRESFGANRAWADDVLSGLKGALIDAAQNDPAVRIVLMPLGHGTHDTDIATLQALEAEFAQAVPGRVATLPFTTDPGTVAERISQASLFITTRYHGTVFAYLTGAPVMCVAYHRKVQVFCDQVGMADGLCVTPDAPFDAAAFSAAMGAAMGAAPAYELPLGSARQRLADALSPLTGWLAARRAGAVSGARRVRGQG